MRCYFQSIGNSHDFKTYLSTSFIPSHLLVLLKAEMELYDLLYSNLDQLNHLMIFRLRELLRTLIDLVAYKADWTRFAAR